MKGLLKGLKRYISRMFVHEKEPEMKIGTPTDVKHVAHIGLDSPSAASTAPSWMNEFKAPSAHRGEVREEDSVKWDSQDSRRTSRKNSRGQTSSAKDKQELPKSSKSTTTTSSINGLGGSSTKEKTDKAKQSKKTRKPKDPNQATESTSKDPKKTSKRKKLKDSTGEGSPRRSRTIQDVDTVSESESRFSCETGFVEREDT